MELEDVKLGLAVILVSIVLLIVSTARGVLIDILIAVMGIIVGLIMVIGYGFQRVTFPTLCNRYTRILATIV